MSTALRLSVIVVSHGRPQALVRCLWGVSHLIGVAVEVVVVADAPGLAAIATLPFAGRIRQAVQVEPNISVARNTGIGLAGGDVLAFIDDDAVPEPTWGAQLLAALEKTGADAVTGTVLGRNGISVQWGMQAVDVVGRDRPLSMPKGPVVPDLPAGDRLKLNGTNFALRRSVLTRTGGFDPAFFFYMDDTDMARRIERAAFAPGAVVHHGFAASVRRTADRIPLSLADIGASTAAFLRKHALPAQVDDALEQMVNDQRARLMRLARRRKLTTDQMRGLMEGLMAGIADGRARKFGAFPVSGSDMFQPLCDVPPPDHKVLTGRASQGARLLAEAQGLAAAGHPVSLFLLSFSPRKHSVEFIAPGIWVQRGGLFGPSVRSDRRLQIWGLAARLAAERARVATVRGFTSA